MALSKQDKEYILDLYNKQNEEGKDNYVLSLLNSKVYKTANKMGKELDENKEEIDKIIETVVLIGKKEVTGRLIKLASKTATVDGLEKQADLFNPKRLAAIMGYESIRVYLGPRRNEAYKSETQEAEVSTLKSVKKRSASVFSLSALSISSRGDKEGYYKRLAITAYFIVACAINLTPQINVFDALRKKVAKNSEKETGTNTIHHLLDYCPTLNKGKLSNHFYHTIQALAHTSKQQRGLVDKHAFAEFLESIATSNYSFDKELTQAILILIKGENAPELQGVGKDNLLRIKKQFDGKENEISKLLKTNEAQHQVAQNLAEYFNAPNQTVLNEVISKLPTYVITVPQTPNDTKVIARNVSSNYGIGSLPTLHKSIPKVIEPKWLVEDEKVGLDQAYFEFLKQYSTSDSSNVDARNYIDTLYKQNFIDSADSETLQGTIDTYIDFVRTGMQDQENPMTEPELAKYKSYLTVCRSLLNEKPLQMTHSLQNR